MNCSLELWTFINLYLIGDLFITMMHIPHDNNFYLIFYLLYDLLSHWWIFTTAMNFHLVIYFYFHLSNETLSWLDIFILKRITLLTVMHIHHIECFHPIFHLEINFHIFYEYSLQQWFLIPWSIFIWWFIVIQVMKLYLGD